MVLIKDNIIGSLQSRLGFSHSHSSRYLEANLELIKNSLVDGNNILVSGFGTFT